MTITDPGTIEERACNGYDLDQFFPDAGNIRAVTEAKAACTRCPITDLCLEWALHHEGGYGHAMRAGYYGGMSPRQRAAESARRNKEAGKTPAARQPATDPGTKECQVCGATVHRGKRSKARWDGMRYCSRSCLAVAMSKDGLPESKVCEHCRNEYQRNGRNPNKWVVSRFCGLVCAGAARRKGQAA